MKKNRVIRVAPARDGKQIASAWRFWVQGNEFYAAPRDVATLGKISFHSNFNWQYRLGKAVFRLARPLRLSENFLHAIQLSFLVEAGVLLPLNQAETKVGLIEVPAGFKLVLNLLISPHSQTPGLTPPVEIGGTVLVSHRLRGGSSLITTSRILEMDANDLSIIKDIQEKIRINFTSLPNKKQVFAEAAWNQFDERTGNAMVIVPVNYGTIQETPSQ